MAPPRAPTPAKNELARAITVFVEGFTFTRSFTHPYLAQRFGSLWVMRDAPRQKAADARREEWVATDEPPNKVHATLRARHRGRFALCVIVPAGANEAEVRAAYKMLGYRLAGTEAFMVHDLRRIPRVASPAKITRVLAPALADAVNQAAGWSQILPAHLQVAAPLRAYAARKGGKVVGWVRSGVCAHGTWCSSMFVQPAHRRQGIGSALLAKMLRDDRRHGARQAVLLAGHAGAKLYAAMGYRRIGTLLLFNPPSPSG